MRRFLIVLAVLGLAAPLWGGGSLEQYLVEKLLSDYQLDPEYVEITLHRSGLAHDDVTGFEVKAYPVTQSAPRGRFPMRVELYRNGALADKGSVSLDVRLKADLPVPVRNIKRYEILTADMFTLKRFDVTSLTEKVLTDCSHLEGCRAKHNLIAGRHVSMSRIENMPVVEKGATVAIIGKSRLFEIRARGVALQNGNIGQTIKVKNIDSRKIVAARVAGPGAVEIDL